MINENKIKKVVIFAGGEGTRLSEYTHLIPKPLVPIGDVPVVIHIMRAFYSQGYREFILAVGYKGFEFKKYFSDYVLQGRDFRFTKNGEEQISDNNVEDWSVIIAETGDSSSTAQRLNAVKKYIGDDDFFVTYGDSVSNVDLSQVENALYTSDSLAAITAINRSERFGILKTDSETGKITNFAEKSNNSTELINGGYIACRNELLNEVNENSDDFSYETLTKLANDGKLSFYHHSGFWAAMDTKKDVETLNKLYSSNPELFGEV